jgi:hypothetical protein
MTDLVKYLNMLKSPKADTRYDACEELRLATESSPEIILALIEATQDENEDVAERAKSALNADVHRQMAIKNEIGLPIFETQPEPDVILGPEPSARKNNRKAIILACSSLLLSVFTFVLFNFLWFLLIWPEAFGKEKGILMICIITLVFFLIALLLSVLAFILIIKNRESRKGLGEAIFSLLIAVLATLFNIWLVLMGLKNILTCSYC